MNHTFAMFLSESLNPGWWRGHGGPRFVQKEWRRLWIGWFIGSLLGIAVHLLTRESRLAPIAHRTWRDLWSSQSFDGLGAYKTELVALCIGLAAIALPNTYLWFLRYARAWWAGITSAVMPLAACGAVGALKYGPAYPKLTTAVGLGALFAMLVTEFWRKQGRPSTAPLRGQRLN